MIKPGALVQALRRWSNRLGVRLSLVLGILLLPLLAALTYQTHYSREGLHARHEAALMGETLRALSGTTRAIQSAQAQAQILSVLLPDVVADDQACSALLYRAQSTLTGVSLVSYIPHNGKMVCASGGQHYDFSGSARLATIMDNAQDIYLMSGTGPVSGVPVLQVMNAVKDEQGNRIGFVSVSLPHDLLMQLRLADLAQSRLENPIGILLFGADGTPLAPADMQQQMLRTLPEGVDLASLAAAPKRTFSALSREGESRAYSVVDMVPGQLYAIGTWPVSALTGTGVWGRVLPFLAPVLMWAGSVLVVYFAMQRMVIRHMRRLARALALFASGKRIVDSPDFRRAPQEVRDLADTYLGMTETILHDEAELEDILRQKEILLREVHHRVKNNLQMISSIISMQSRKARTPEARAMLKGLQSRVISLATVHRDLYSAQGLSEISAQSLVRDIVRQLVRAATGRDHADRVQMKVDDIGLSPDQAVPLSLLLTEALTNALKYARSADGPPRIMVTLTREEGHIARLEIRNSCIPGEDRTPSMDGGLGLPLITAFVQQLGGHAEVHEDGGDYIVSVEFEVRIFQDDDDV